MNKKNKYIYRGFDLKSITWGYRDRFKKAIDGLYETKLLGRENEPSTIAFFELLQKGGSEQNSCFDHVLNNFICSLNTENNWILKIPALFSDWTGFGAELSRHKLYMGLGYFEVWGRGGFGKTPEEVSYVLDKARWLTTVDFELAYHFIQSYHLIRRFLNHREIDVFIENSLVLYNRNPENAYNFLQLKTKTARLYTLLISREARLADCKSRLANLARAIADFDLEISDFSELDSDDLLERGSSLVSINKWLYLPAKVSLFPERDRNIEYYMLLTALVATGLQFKSFNVMHGKKNAGSSLAFIKSRGIKQPSLVNNCFIVFEIHRILQILKNVFPGIIRILKAVLAIEIKNHPLNSKADKLLVMMLKKIAGKRIHPDEDEK